MTTEANKQVVREFVDAINRQDWRRFDELVAPDFIRHSSTYRRFGVVTSYANSWSLKPPHFSRRARDRSLSGGRRRHGSGSLGLPGHTARAAWIISGVGQGIVGGLHQYLPSRGRSHRRGVGGVGQFEWSHPAWTSCGAIAVGAGVRSQSAGTGLPLQGEVCGLCWHEGVALG